MAQYEKFAGCDRYIDMWALPGAHPSNMELLQKLKTAETHHFTKEMDIVGTVSSHHAESDSWQDTHLVGLRTDVWNADAKEMEKALRRVRKDRKRTLRQKLRRHGRLSAKERSKLDNQVETDAVMQLQTDEITSRRLVMKLFKNTGSRARWCGTLEEITTTEVCYSMGSRRRLLTMVAVLPRTQMVSYVQQNHRTFRIPAVFTFNFYQDRRMWNLLVRRNWFSLGSDYTIQADGQGLGEIDGKLISFGGDSYLHMDPHPLAEQTQLVDLLTLFTASTGYHNAMRKSTGQRIAAAEAGQWQRNLIEDEELRMHHNGRAAA